MKMKLKRLLVKTYCFFFDAQYRKKRYYRRKFIDFHKNSNDKEIQEMLHYMIDTDSFDMMNCYLEKNYDVLPINITKCGNLYVVKNEDGDEIFLARDSLQQAESTFRSLLREQDEKSPHCYLTASERDKLISFVKESNGYVRVFELGAQEGMFSLSLAKYVNEIHLFECDNNWCRALEKTFTEYHSIVTVTNKYISDIDNNNHCTLDNYYKAKDKSMLEGLTIIKMDIEGAEVDALRGMRDVIDKSENVILLVCAYHRYNDEKEIIELFSGGGYNVFHSPGWFCFYVADDYKMPYVRRCLLKIEKKDQIIHIFG